mmetsp:Transcript_8165/g.26956  ORF Transcript_8165/g.26956 Transcript_8165/m.26956 type:complete len:157 (-) Transcript_8165:147-617(-)
MDLSGQCQCGKVTFHAKGAPIMNVYCHCRACSRAMGMSPVHLVCFSKDAIEITAGEDNLQMVQGHGKMEHYHCNQCLTQVYQTPAGAPFNALFPTTFRIETPDPSLPCGVSCKLPTELLPTVHINYENRLTDWADDLPKLTGFPGSPPLKNNGTPM